MKTALLAGALVLAGGLYANAQELVMAEPEAIRNVARGHGSASLDTSDAGAPMITGRVEGRAYAIFFDNCDDGIGCLDMRLFAVFPGNKATLELLNDWNREKRWGKAYADGDLDAAIELDVNMSSGLPFGTVDRTIEIWVETVQSFAAFIGED